MLHSFVVLMSPYPSVSYSLLIVQQHTSQINTPATAIHNCKKHSQPPIHQPHLHSILTISTKDDHSIPTHAPSRSKAPPPKPTSTSTKPSPSPSSREPLTALAQNTNINLQHGNLCPPRSHTYLFPTHISLPTNHPPSTRTDSSRDKSTPQQPNPPLSHPTTVQCPSAA